MRYVTSALSLLKALLRLDISLAYHPEPGRTKRQIIFAAPNNIELLQKAVSIMKAEMPFEMTAAIISDLHYNRLKPGLAQCPDL